MIKLIRWGLDYGNDREFAKSSFGEIHFEWHASDRPGLPIPDFKASHSIFSKKAIEALREPLEKYGDIHPVIMETGESYFLFDCWSWIEFTTAGVVFPTQDGHIKAVEVHTETVLPELFRFNGLPGLVINEDFKTLCEKAGLVGMVFHPFQIKRTDKVLSKDTKLFNRISRYCD